MAKGGGPTVGLDIGSQTIKVVEAVPGRDGVTVRAIGMAPTPPGAMENNVIVDPKLLGDAVKKALREAGVSTKSSVSSVSGQGALVVRVIETPRMSDSELGDHMRWEVERHVPFAADQVIMDYQPIERPDTPPDSQNMDVLLAVAQQDMIDRHVEMLFAAGLSPSAIDVEPLAASRALIELGPDPYGERTVVVINVGASNTDLGIFRNGILAFPRTIPYGGTNLTTAIAAAMGIGVEQAEEMKVRHGEVLLGQAAPAAVPGAEDEAFLDFSVGAPTPAEEPDRAPFDLSSTEEGAQGPQFDLDEPAEAAVAPVPIPIADGDHDETTMQVFSAMAPILGDLLQDIRRSLEYYQGRTSDARVDEILLCGGSANLKNLDQFLAAELGIPTRMADAFEHARVAARNYSAEHVRQVAPFFAVALGLAARDMVAVPARAAAGRKRAKK
ncbi:MAG: type IV pilus assembly protein PilM [Chthonomonadales bacterium]|nr:type IV pilus assembly protein PilM [Chthonomonadales bacterium]